LELGSISFKLGSRLNLFLFLFLDDGFGLFGGGGCLVLLLFEWAWGGVCFVLEEVLLWLLPLGVLGVLGVVGWPLRYSLKDESN